MCLCVLQGVGAVASRRAAELYGLDILEENVQDAQDNVTRFIKLSRYVAQQLDPVILLGYGASLGRKFSHQGPGCRYMYSC